MATFIPDPDKTGDFLKPEFGDGPKFLGFKPDMRPVYEFLGSVQDPLIKKSAEDFKIAWAAFNAAIAFPPSIQSTLVNTRDLLNTVKAVNETLIKVLDTLLPFADFNVNVLETAIKAVILLLNRILDTLNPGVSAHLLVIPPRIGNTISIDSTSSIGKSLAAKLQVNESVTGLLTSSVQRIPSLRSARLRGTETGSLYLLNTIRNKISDAADHNRPLLRSSSHYAGVGLFFGSSNIVSLVNQYSKVINLFGLIDKTNQDTSLPPVPKVIGPSRVFKTDTLDNFVVYPVKPLLDVQIVRDTMLWSHIGRVELVSSVLVDPKTEIELQFSLVSMVKDANSTNNFLAGAVSGDIKAVSSLEVVNAWSRQGSKTNVYSSDLPSTSGTLAVLIVDVYTVNISGTPTSVPRISDIYRCKWDPTYQVKNRLDYVAKFQHTADAIGSPSAIQPRWVSSSLMVNLLPPVFSNLATLLDLIKAWLTALIDETLNVLKVIINSIKASLTVISKILTAIDEFIALLQQLLNLNLSCSAITFAGDGGRDSLIEVFEQYFKNSGAPDKFHTTGIDLTSSSTSLTYELATAVGSVDEPIDIDKKAKEILDSKDKARKQRESQLDAVLNQEYRWVTGDAGKVSPTFDAKDTTAGLVLLAYSETAANVQAAKLLFDLLFNAESETSNQDTSTNEAIASQSGLPVTSVFSDIPQGLKINEKIETGGILFGEDMQPVTSADQSPFRFCP